MPKTTYASTNFCSGEISPLAMGRFDLSKYQNGCALLENFLINQLGGVLYRPGTRFVVEVKDSSAFTRLIPFQYSTTQNYIIELGNLYLRFCTAHAQLVSGTPVEVTGYWTTAQLPDVKYAQDADTMYMVHPSVKPYKLQRTSATTFTLTAVPFVRGPFLDDNITATTITPSAATGAGITLTASAATFLATNVGGFFKVHSAVVKITAFTSTTVVTGDVQAEPDGAAGNIGGTSAYTDWAEGAFSNRRGWPAAVAFHDQRLWYGNTTYEPQKIWGSQLNTYDSFDVGTTADDDSPVFAIATEQVNAIKWLSSSNKQMDLGTSGGTFPANGGTEAIITPTNISVYRSTTIGAAGIQPRRLSNYLYFVQRDLNRLRELFFDFNLDNQKANDMCLFADHILKDGSGARNMDYQQSPNERIWVVRNDGQLAVMTRNVDQEVLGWSRLIAGSTVLGVGLFESVAVIQQDEADDQVWVIVNHLMHDGSVKRYIEYFMPEDFTDFWDAVRLDCSLTLDSPITISGATAASPVVITATSHGFSDGDQVKIDGVVGMTQLNGRYFLVANKSTHTFELTSLAGVNVNGAAYTAYLSGGEVRKMVTAISGLDHLEGETVSVTVDGGLPSETQTFEVVGGAITLPNKAAVVHVGLPYVGNLKLLKLSDGSATGTGQTKNRRIYLSTLRVYKSLGIKIGMTEELLEAFDPTAEYVDTSLVPSLDTIYFRSPNDPLGEVTPYITGDIEKNLETYWSKTGEVYIRQNTPLPLCILAVILRSEVSEA